MKTFKKVSKVLLIVFLMAVWLNIGYYFEKSIYEAEVKYLGGASLNTLEKFQMGPNHFWAPKNPKEITERTDLKWRGVYILLWPICVLAWVGAWMVKGVIIAALAAGQGVVWLFRLIFCGGLFKLIGSYIAIMAAVAIIWFWLFRKSLKKNK